jgi:hypothetical protein
MPVATPGLVRLRKHQLGRQTDFGTAVAAKRAYPFSGTPDANLNWEDSEGDFGSLDIVAPPTRGAADLTAGLSAPVVYYNDIPAMLSAMFGDAVTPSGGGTSKTWVHQPASLTPDDIDLFTYEFGDDLDGTSGKPNDWFQFSDGLLESLTITGPESLGALNADMSWRFGGVRYAGATEAALQPSPAVPTSALTVDANGVPVYLGNAQLFIDSAFADIGDTQIADALHSFTLTINQELDQKRFANGTGFDLSGYGRGARTIELECQFAKTSDTVGTGSESDAWFSETAVNRFVRIEITSLATAETGSPDVPYSWVIDMPLRYYTRSDGNLGGNTTITLMGRAFYNSDLGFPFKSTVVNTLAAASL